MKGVETLVKHRIDSFSNKKVEDVDDIFGKMVASKVHLFPDDVKLHVKHEINNVIYKFKLQERQKEQLFITSTRNPPPPLGSPTNLGSLVYSNGRGWWHSNYQLPHQQEQKQQFATQNSQHEYPAHNANCEDTLFTL